MNTVVNPRFSTYVMLSYMAEPAWWCLWPPTSSLSTTMSHDLLWPSQYCDLITSVDNATLFCASQVRFGSHRCKKGPICIIMFPAKLHAYSVFALFKTFENFDVPRRHNLVMVITLCRQCLVFPEKKSANQSLSQASFEKQKSGLNLCTHL